MDTLQSYVSPSGTKPPCATRRVLKTLQSSSLLRVSQKRRSYAHLYFYDRRVLAPLDDELGNAVPFFHCTNAK